MFMCTRSSDSKQLVLTEELFTDDVMNSEYKLNIILFFIIKLMQQRHIPTSLFNYLFYLICILSFIYFSLGRSP